MNSPQCPRGYEPCTLKNEKDQVTPGDWQWAIGYGQYVEELDSG